MDIQTFIEKLQAYHSDLVFNPWSEFDASCDIGEKAPVIRSETFKRYLECVKMPSIFLLRKA